MERIEINGFLTIDHADFEIRKINILIGAQAQGKSVIAKLAYFFKNFFSDVLLESVEKHENKRDVEKNCLAQFEQIFPAYTWADQVFSIVYKYENYEVSITRTKVGDKYILKFNYCKCLAALYNKLKNAHKLALKEFDVDISEEIDEDFGEQINRYSFEQFFQKMWNTEFSEACQKSIFIPATRSFFAPLQKNVFSFLANNIDIDPFIKEFGSHYEFSKHLHSKKKFPLKSLKRDGIDGANENIGNEVIKKLNKLFSEIVSGDYIFAEKQDWIISKGKRTNLINASSGQQESLPMLLILTIWPFKSVNNVPTTFFIEEPEAHLFPISQKQIISLIATIYNAFGHSFFITTHSPYILTAINNLVVGQDAYDKANGDKNKLKKLAKVLATDELIRLEDVSAYTLNKGKLESIIDLENRLIGANLLDTVSDEFDAAFSVATEILYRAD